MADFCEACSRHMYYLHKPEIAGVWQPQVHKSCAHNMVAGLLQRTMGPTPEPTEPGKEMYLSAVRLLSRVIKGRSGSVEPWDLGRVVASYKEKRLRVRYETAHRSLLSDGFSTTADAKVKAFVKAEKLMKGKVSKPRVIMGRDPRYNLELASYLKPIEHVVYPAFRGFGRQFYTHTRLIAKGLNGEQRAALIRRKFESHPDMVAFEVDGKSFESHHRVFQLKGEHSVYTSLCRDPRLRELLSWQLRFSGVGTGGVRFYVEGVRASGDFNTGLGNTIVMCSLVLAVAQKLGTRFDFLADGDNAIVFVRRSDVHTWVNDMPPHVLSMGHEFEVGEVVDSLSGIVFGQSKPIFADGRWTMVREPFKVLSHAASGFQHYSELRGGARVMKSVAYCEAVLNRGVPVLQAYAQALLKATRHVTFAGNVVYENLEYKRILDRGIRWEEAKNVRIGMDSRLLFEKSWGISPDDQQLMEKELSSSITLPSTWVGTQVEAVGDSRDYWTYPDTIWAANWLDQLWGV